MMEEMMRLSIVEYMVYLKGSEHYSEYVVEGEELLNAGHLLLAGITDQHLNKIFIYALCDESSTINHNPHEIKGELMIIKDNALKINAMHCSCTAGNSGRCKHISALLIKCIRVDNIESLEEISQTGINSVWSNEHKDTNDNYKPVPVEEMPRYKQKITRRLSVDNADILNFFCKQLPNSSVAKHRQGRRD
ncbi:uncharacterized protein LOC126887611 [Diabrotica virgifera virgifera]|uniref:SWIM-type domain-containing protein n=1 Tax=Diabrotica virgifera virgifera TaxID=50390 RepID=A0ABM5KLT7_DIAVI|nr:uncharacterized protein LOC126887611 [Diabrotica virgifera virgifera]